MPSTLTYQQALDELNNYGNLSDPEVTRLLDQLVTREKSYGENNPFVTSALKRIVQRCRCQGKRKEAEALNRRTLEIYEAVHGKYHVEVAEQLIDLGFSCWEQKKYGEAEPYYQRSICILETKLEPYDLKIAEAKHSLGSCYFQQGKYKKAKELYKQVLEIYKLTLDPNDSRVTSARKLLYSCKKKLKSKVDEFKKRMQIRVKKRRSNAIDADGKFTNSHRRPVAAKKAKIVHTVDPRATSSASGLAVASTAMISSSLDKDQRLLEAKARIENLQSTSERTIAELKAEIAEKSSQLAEAKRTIESHLSCSICKDEDANRMWSTCHHVATCEHCAMELLRRDMGKSGNGISCPICQTLGFPLKVFI